MAILWLVCSLVVPKRYAVSYVWNLISFKLLNAWLVLNVLDMVYLLRCLNVLIEVVGYALT
jgi:hypothetical protein